MHVLRHCPALHIPRAQEAGAAVRSLAPDIKRIHMPKALEARLAREAKKKGLGKERTGAYVYGTLRKTGWTPSTQHKVHSRTGR